MGKTFLLTPKNEHAKLPAPLSTLSSSWKDPLRKLIFAVFVSVLMAPTGILAATPDANATIRQFLDGFNSGDTKSMLAAYSTGDVTIVDEFAPHRWVGPHAHQAWSADYEKHAQAAGISDGSVKYGAPTRTEVEGDAAYVVIPTTYLYKEHSQAMEEEGQMTFVLHTEDGGWKIQSWTWTGAKPHAK